MEKTLKPSLRFKGFTDAWEQRKLGSIGSTFTGLSGKTKEDFGHGEARFVTYMNVFSNPISNPETVESVEIDNNQNQVQKGDVFFTTSSETPEEVGMSSVWLNSAENTYLNSFCFGYRPTIMFNPYFLGSMLRSPSIRQDIVLLAQGISRYNISKTKVMDIEVPIPNLQEQAKIGETFRSIDSLITLHQRKYEKLINIKKALLDKMFPKNGELVPQLRFKGFTDAWEQRGLSELAQVTMGQSPNGINYTSNPEDHILVQGNADMENGWVTPRVWTTQITKIAEPNDLVFSVRAPVGAVGKTKFKAVIGRGVASIRGNEFVFQELLRLNMNNYWKTISTGSTFDSISSTELKTTIVRAPQIDEQNKIGGFLNSIDSLITLHQRKYEKLVNIKKALLQKMFV
jgi:type I restriction enzyme S subunit